MKPEIILLFDFRKWYVTPIFKHSVLQERKSHNTTNNGYGHYAKHWNYTSVTFLFLTIEITNLKPRKVKEVPATH